MRRASWVCATLLVAATLASACSSTSGRPGPWPGLPATAGSPISDAGNGPSSPPADGATPSPQPSPTGIALRLAQIAQTTAKDTNGASYAGEPFKTADAVLTRHADAARYLLGVGMSGNEPVYAIQIVGTFVCTDCPRAPGGGPPHGTVLIDLVDATTFAPAGGGIIDKIHDLSHLGTVIHLLP